MKSNFAPFSHVAALRAIKVALSVLIYKPGLEYTPPEKRVALWEGSESILSEEGNDA